MRIIPLIAMLLFSLAGLCESAQDGPFRIDCAGGSCGGGPVRAAVAAHEGEAKGKVLNVVTAPARWIKSKLWR